MLIFAIDDEPKALKDLHKAIVKAAPEAEVMDFSLAAKALRTMETGLKPDIVFSDIRMPGIDGMMLARRLKQTSPTTGIVFVSAFTKYAYDAMKLRVDGYVMKPAQADRIREEIGVIVSRNASRNYDEKVSIQ